MVQLWITPYLEKAQGTFQLQLKGKHGSPFLQYEKWVMMLMMIIMNLLILNNTFFVTCKQMNKKRIFNWKIKKKEKKK